MEPELVWRLLVGQLFFFMISLASVFRSGGGEAKGDVDLGGEPLWILVPLRIAGLLLWGSVLAYIFAGDMIAWGRWSLPFVVSMKKGKLFLR